MIATFLVVGRSATDREQAIVNELRHRQAVHPSPQKTAILIEGLSDGKPLLFADDTTLIARIAAGCLCCSNSMIMRIYLNRLIRQKPQQLFLSLSTDTHLVQIRQFLSEPEYAGILELEKILTVQ